MTTLERKTCRTADGVEIVYSAAGRGSTALVFIHGGLANRGFWDGEVRTFAGQYRVITLDLAGHGESGTDREKWGIPEFGADVRSVVDAEHLQKVILFGNSLGGPVAIEAALQLASRAVGVVGIDTFQSLRYSMSLDDAKARAKEFRDDYRGNLHKMVVQLFHSGADPQLIADAENRMTGTSPETAYKMFISLGGYQPATAAERLTIPLRAINGDLYPTDVAANRQIKSDFDVAIMKHMGHYPMLERPHEFDELVGAVATNLLKTTY